MEVSLKNVRRFIDIDQICFFAISLKKCAMWVNDERDIARRKYQQVNTFVYSPRSSFVPPFLSPVVFIYRRDATFFLPFPSSDNYTRFISLVCFLYVYAVPILLLFL